MKQLFSNNASATLAQSLTSVSTTLTVQTGYGALFPNPGVNEYFLLTLFKVVGGVQTAIEIVKCTARAGDQMTIVRAQEGLGSTTYDIGDFCEMRLTRGTLETLQSYSNLSDVPATFTPTNHNHPISEVTGLQTILDGKAASSHTHTLANVDKTIALRDPVTNDLTGQTVTYGDLHKMLFSAYWAAGLERDANQ